MAKDGKNGAKDTTVTLAGKDPEGKLTKLLGAGATGGKGGR